VWLSAAERDIQDDMLGHLSTVISEMKEILIDMNTAIQWYVVVFRSRFEVALIRFCMCCILLTFVYARANESNSNTRVSFSLEWNGSSFSFLSFKMQRFAEYPRAIFTCKLKVEMISSQ
jgi:hypothetical protein